MNGDLVIRSCEAADQRGTRTGRVDIVIRGGLIVEICAAGESRASDIRHVNGHGMTVVPGLINMHEHLGVVHPGTHEEQDFANETGAECLRRMTRNAEAALRVGVTTLRLAGEKDGLDIELRASIDARQVTGPRIWTAAQPLDYLGGGRSFVGAIECSSVDDYRRVAKEQIERGADLLKVMLSGGVASHEAGTVGLSIEQFEAVRLVAREARVRIAVHTAATPHPIMDKLVDDGVDSLEHCYLMDARLLKRCVSKGVLLVLTPLVSRSPQYLEELGLAPRSIELMKQAGEAHWRIVCSAVEANARIALGTDLHSHVMLHGAPAPVRELELYEEAGAAPEMLLSIASRNGASWLGVGERLGLVEEGFEADLLMLEDNPFRSGAAAFRALRHVISLGTLIES